MAKVKNVRVGSSIREGCWSNIFNEALLHPIVLNMASRVCGIKSPATASVCMKILLLPRLPISVSSTPSHIDIMNPFVHRTPAHVKTKKINFPVKRPSSGPSLAMVRQTPSFKLFAIPKEADNIDVKKVKANKAGEPPMIVLDIDVSFKPSSK